MDQKNNIEDMKKFAEILNASDGRFSSTPDVVNEALKQFGKGNVDTIGLPSLDPHDSQAMDRWNPVHNGNIIHSTAMINWDVVRLGKNNFIGPYCVIGERGEYAEHWNDAPREQMVVIGDNNHFTKFCTIDAGSIGSTIIRNNCWFLARAHVGHDAYIEDDCIVSVGAAIGGLVHMMKGANVGLNASVHQRHLVGAYSMIGMNAAAPLSRAIKPFQKYAGVPIKPLGTNHMKEKIVKPSEIIGLMNHYERLFNDLQKINP